MHIFRKHKEFLEEIYRGKKKSAQFLLGEHNRLFADWFEKKVSPNSFSFLFGFSCCFNMCGCYDTSVNMIMYVYRLVWKWWKMRKLFLRQ